MTHLYTVLAKFELCHGVEQDVKEYERPLEKAVVRIR